MDEESEVYDLCMSGFLLANTLSENGGVTRGICQIDEDGFLEKVTETYEIQKTGDGLSARDEAGNPVTVDMGCYASMNMWGIPASFIDELERGFPEFLAGIKDGDVKSEYLLPRIIDKMVKERKVRVKVLETADKWFGVTYKEDKPAVVESLRKLIAEGVYPERLYK